MFGIKFCKAVWQHRKYCKIINQIYEEESIQENLSSTFGFKFEKDWWGRLWTVVNPAIKDGKFNYEDIIFEADKATFTMDGYTEKYVMSVISGIKEYVLDKELFDLLTYSLKAVDKHGNYLLVIEPVTFQEYLAQLKKTAKITGILSILSLVAVVACKIWIF